jgi:tetratricopeptide (TPR) repeat protein
VGQTKVPELLSRLVDQSLVVPHARGKARFRMLETLAASAGDRARQLRRCHRLGVPFRSGDGCSPQGRPGGVLADRPTSLRVASSWRRLAPGSQGWVTSRAQRSPPEEAFGVVRDLELRDEVPFLLVDLGNLQALLEHFEGAATLHREALALTLERGARDTAAHAPNGLALAARRQGHYGSARELHLEALSFFREAGFTEETAYSLACLGFVEELRGDLNAAEAFHRESLLLTPLPRRSGSTPIGRPTPPSVRSALSQRTAWWALAKLLEPMSRCAGRRNRSCCDWCGVQPVSLASSSGLSARVAGSCWARTGA